MSKYVIEIEKRPFRRADSISVDFSEELYRVEGFNSLVFDKHGLDKLEPLTAEYVNEHFGSLQDDAYNKGLEDAWELARKMLRMCDADLLDIFTECYASVCTALQAIQKYTVHEALAKLQAYEQKHKEDADFCVGDEVQSEFGDNCIVTKSSVGVDKKQMYVMFGDGSTGEREKVYFHRTGKHYDIAALLKKMKGE